MVVIFDLVPVGQSGIDVTVRFKGADSEVDSRSRIPDEYLSVFLGRRAVDGTVLGEAGEHGCVSPGRVVQDAIDYDLRFQPRYRDVQFALHTAVDHGLRAGQRLETRSGGHLSGSRSQL